MHIRRRDLLIVIKEPIHKVVKVKIYLSAANNKRKKISHLSTVKVRAKREIQLQAFRSSKSGILNQKHALILIEQGIVEPFHVVSKNLAENFASVIDRYKSIAEHSEDYHDNQKDYYNTEQVAELFGISKHAVYKWIEKDIIKYERTLEDGRDIRIPKDQFKNLHNPSNDFLKRMEDIIGDSTLQLSDPKDIFRSGSSVE